MQVVCKFFKGEVVLSVYLGTDLLSSISKRLDLKEEPIDTYDAVENGKIEPFWDNLQLVDGTLTCMDTTMKAFKD